MASRLQPVIAELKSLGVRVSLFMDRGGPDDGGGTRDWRRSRRTVYGTLRARVWQDRQAPVLARYVAAAKAAQREGLGVNAGHDLNRDNLPLFLRTVPGVLEVSIGHALIADALEFGIKRTVKLYLDAVSGGRAA